jgi:hypothetical protein
MYLHGNSIGTDNGRQTTDDRQQKTTTHFKSFQIGTRYTLLAYYFGVLEEKDLTFLAVRARREY